MNYQEIEGDLITLAKEGKFEVIAHGCNCFCRMKRGIAPQMAFAFGCDYFPLEKPSLAGDINKLGQIDYQSVYVGGGLVQKQVIVVNAYTQYQWSTETKPLDYEALTLCLRKMNKLFAGKHIGLPLIGCHLAGGIWDKMTQEGVLYHGYLDVKTIIQKELKDCKVTIVHYKV